eukprot:TRINITY_DN15244_c0_g1_i2.p1 TRINITY_DN15244_c0_g1~~TRINITY_DN15244_c0_g1_i2.p1  ORF type:complete len:909 (-),score=121.52 TRINITY_DN15244_c0_g1_i2:350-3076(-)
MSEVAGAFLAPEERWTKNTAKLCNFVQHQNKQEFDKCTMNECQISLATDELDILGEPGFFDNRSVRSHAGCKCMPTRAEPERCRNVSIGKQGELYGQARVTIRVIGRLPEGALSAWHGSAAFESVALEAARRSNFNFDVIRALNESKGKREGEAIVNEGDVGLLMQQYWETGEVRKMPYYVIPDYVFPNLNVSGVVCDAEEVCYCGAGMCTYVNEPLVSSGVDIRYDVRIPTSPVSTASDLRRLEQRQMPGLTNDERYSGGAASRQLSSTTDVALVWGLKINPESPLLGKREKSWEFNRIFRADSPNTQRMLLQACQKANTLEQLLIVTDRSECWIERFRSWLKATNREFPVPGNLFLSTFSTWRASSDGSVMPSGVVVKDFMWLGADGTLKATYSRFHVNINYQSTAASTIVKYMSHWKELVDTLNSDAPLEAGDTWHTSRLWIRAEAETAIVSSTVNTMLVSAGCGFVGALFFTHLDVVLSAMVVITVAGVTISLAWFMIVFMGWAVGAMEVLGLIVFVGYSITYSLHIAHKYQEHVITLQADDKMSSRERREKAVLHSMRCMSGAVIGSAVTTLGSSFFLFFCQLVIFVKLASVLFAVTFFAMLFATMALPAALLFLGPTSSGWAVNLWRLVMRAKAGELSLNEIGNAPPPERLRSTKSLAMVAQQPTASPQAQKLPEDDISVRDTSSATALLQSSEPVSRPSGMITADSRHESRKTEASRNDNRKTEVFLSAPSLPSASPALSGRRLPSPAISVAPAPLGRRCTSLAPGTPGSPSRSAASMRQTTAATFWGEQADDTGSQRYTLPVPPPAQLQLPTSPGFRSLQEWSSKPCLPSPLPTPGAPASSPALNFAALSMPAVQSYVGGGGTGQLPSWSGAAIARMSTAQHGRSNISQARRHREAHNRQ